MGMAASQARYLALVARKSNCEYEGQQINQARTALSNQSANLFNQMLGLQVPVPPSTQDFTKQQYSYTDGINDSVIDSWQQLANPESDYNYVVTHHYYADVYTGSQKQMNDPQVQFSGAIPSITSDYHAQIAAIQKGLEEITEAEKLYKEASDAYETLKSQASNLSYYADNSSRTNVSNSTLNPDGSYTVSYKDAEGTAQTSTYLSYSETPDANVLAAVKSLVSAGALDKDLENPDMTDIYYSAADGTIAFKSDLEKLIGSTSTSSSTILPTYHIATAGTPEGINNINDVLGANGTLAQAKVNMDKQKALLDIAQATYDAMSVPDYIGNIQLTAISEPTPDQQAEIDQIIKDMEAQGVDTDLTRCFDADGNYTGGIYSFVQNGITYFTTYYDLAETAGRGEGINNIDAQPRLSYYNASYVSTKIEETEKALLQTDANGRFSSVRFENDTITYSLNAETVTDDVAYQDAMNQYYYENAQYDKLVQDINAKTSIIQQEDRTLELRLKQLDTEQNALSTEIDAVSKVVKDNIEKSFKTFGG